MKPANISLLAVVGAQCVCLLAMAVAHERRLIADDVILLNTRPVDPRDLLRGDYVILNYDISTLSNDLFVAQSAPTRPGQVVHVELSKDGEFHVPVRASVNRFEAGPGNVILSGTSAQVWDTKNVRVEYGLERFYVREGTGNVRGKLTAEVAVSKSGKGALKQVYVDGVPYAEVARRADQRQ